MSSAVEVTLQMAKETEARCRKTWLDHNHLGGVAALGALDQLIEAKMVRFKLEMLLEEERAL